MLTLKAWARTSFLLLLLTWTAVVHAQNICVKPQVFYINGVWNFDGYTATGTATSLNEALVAGGAPGNLFIRTIWSPGGVADDLLEVLIAKYWDEPGSDFVDAILGELGPLASSIVLQAEERYRDQVDKVKNQVLAEITGTKTPVLMIAHSQGNIAVNQAVTELQNQNADTTGIRSIGILGIANADQRSSVGAFYRYITSTRDKVIRPLPLAAPANFVDTPLSGLAHDVAYYLEPNPGRYGGEPTLTNTRAQIQKLFLEVFNATQASWPCVELTSTPNPTNIDQATTLAVTVKARPLDLRIPEGLVLVREGDRAVCSVVLDDAGKGTCAASFSEAGSHSLKARYTLSPKGIFEAADSAVYVQSVNSAQPTNYTINLVAGDLFECSVRSFPATPERAAIRINSCRPQVFMYVTCTAVPCGGIPLFNVKQTTTVTEQDLFTCQPRVTQGFQTPVAYNTNPYRFVFDAISTASGPSGYGFCGTTTTSLEITASLIDIRSNVLAAPIRGSFVFTAPP